MIKSIEDTLHTDYLPEKRSKVATFLSADKELAEKELRYWKSMAKRGLFVIVVLVVIFYNMG